MKTRKITIFFLCLFPAFIFAGYQYGGYLSINQLSHHKYKINLFAYVPCGNPLSDTANLVLIIKNTSASYPLTLKYVKAESNGVICSTSCPGQRYITWELFSIVDFSVKPFDSLIKSGCEVEFVAFSRTLPGVQLNTVLISTYVVGYNAKLNVCNSDFSGYKSPAVSRPVYTKISDKVYFNSGIYPNKNDSFVFELVCLADTAGNCATYKSGFDATYPFNCKCPGGGNSCAPNPAALPPRGFYLNKTTGDIVFQSTNNNDASAISLRVHQFHKDSNSLWTYCGYVTQTTVQYSGNLFNTSPYFSVPERIDVCENDSVLVTIKAEDDDYWDSLAYDFDGNAENYTIDITPNNGRPIAKVKFKANNSLVNDRPYFFTVRTRDYDNYCPLKTESSKTFLVYYHTGISSEIQVQNKICNSITCKARSISPKLEVRHNWQIYKDSWSSKPIYIGNGDSITVMGLEKARYYVKCIVSTPKAYCTQRTYLDSIDLINLWPGLDFNINKTTFCLYTGEHNYYPTNLKAFTSPLTYKWEIGSETSNADTIVRYFSKDTIISLLISDQKGCRLSKSFVISRDQIYNLSVTRDTLLCGAQSFELGSFDSINSLQWAGTWKVISGTKDTTDFGLSTRINFPFKQAHNSVFSTFVSQDYCKREFQISVEVDTTIIRLTQPIEYCRNNGILNLTELNYSPVGGNWSNNISQSSLVQVDTFPEYPRNILAFYQFKNFKTGCIFIDTLSITVLDTSRLTLPTIKPICHEVKHLNAGELFYLPVGGLWSSNTQDFKIDTGGGFKPFETSAGIYSVSYFNHTKICPEKYFGTIVIRDSQLQLNAKTDTNSGFQPLKITFYGINALDSLNSTRYFWHFGDPKSGNENSAEGAVSIHSYESAGIYYPVLTAEKEGCWDTVKLDSINVQLTNIQYLFNSNARISPNPFSSYITVEMPTELCNNYLVCDINGKCVITGPITQRFTRINTNKLNSGVYFFILIEGDRPLSITRIIKSNPD